MASYVADTKVQTEAKNELIKLLMGLVVSHNDSSLRKAPEVVLWTQLDFTQRPLPSQVQRVAYVDEVFEQVNMLGSTAGLWKVLNGARMAGMEAVMDYLDEKEKADPAKTLREAAKKLESAANHLQPTYRSFQKTMSPSDITLLKREREEEFEGVDGKLEDVMKAVRDFKKAKQSHESPAAAKIGESAKAREKLPLISNLPALISTQLQESPMTDTAVSPEEGSESARRSLKVLINVPQLRDIINSRELGPSVVNGVVDRTGFRVDWSWPFGGQWTRT